MRNPNFARANARAQNYGPPLHKIRPWMVKIKSLLIQMMFSLITLQPRMIQNQENQQRYLPLHQDDCKLMPSKLVYPNQLQHNRIAG